MPRVSNKAKTVAQLKEHQQLAIEETPVPQRMAIDIDSDDDSFEDLSDSDLDEDMELCTPDQDDEDDIPPWLRDQQRPRVLSASCTITELLLAYAEDNRYLDSRTKHIPKLATIEAWFSQPIMQDPRTFRLCMRMSRPSFFNLLQKIENHEVFSNKAHCPQTPVKYQLATFLYYLGAGSASHAHIALPLGIGEGTVTLFCRRVLAAVLSLKTEMIQWPGEQARAAHAARVCVASGGVFANCVGFVDGTYIILRYAPLTDWYYYYNRKSSYGLNAMVVCDDRRRILYTRVGDTSAVHDTRVFDNSRLGREPDEFFSAGEYLLGDSAYTCTDHMITPFKKPRARQRNETRFNATLSSRRIAIEHVFGILKARFPAVTRIGIRITGPETHKLVVDWFEAACILHNFLLDEREEPEWDNDGDLAMAFEHQREVDEAREEMERARRVGGPQGNARKDLYRESILQVFVENYMS
jgi:hypothetical protein